MSEMVAFRAGRTVASASMAVVHVVDAELAGTAKSSAAQSDAIRK